MAGKYFSKYAFCVHFYMQLLVFLIFHFISVVTLANSKLEEYKCDANSSLHIKLGKYFNTEIIPDIPE